MRAWRALKASGAAVLRDGVYLIPATGDTRTVLARVEQDIEASGGSAWLLNVGDADYPFAALFDRTADYNELAEDITKCRDALKAEPGPALARRVRKLRNAYESLAAIDFFPEEARRQTGDRLDALERQLAGAQSSDEPTGTSGAVKRRKAARYQGRLWATRKRMWVDRMGSAWLIRRFIDPQARFAWLDSPDDCPRDALGFDFDGATFSHVETPGGLLVTFETLIESFGLHEDAALRRLAQIVHCLDVGGLTVAEAAGLERILSGIRARTRNDDSLLKAAGRVFDDLYLAFQHEAEPA
ncbi:MAG: chromate resistance protein, partial [Thiogranum sp.]|nr:chromate resistance protein [Thiogranum sp.]